jgi:hypothetical protein
MVVQASPGNLSIIRLFLSGRAEDRVRCACRLESCVQKYFESDSTAAIISTDSASVDP